MRSSSPPWDEPVSWIGRLLLALLVPMAAACSSVPAEPPSEPPAKRIALSFDDAPMAHGPLFSGRERTQRLIAALKTARVPQAAIFVTTEGLGRDEGKARIRAYAAAGHPIANHSHQHRRLKAIGPEAYLADIDKAEAELKRFPNRRPWFRFPYLNESPDVASRDAVRAGLKARGLANGYVTVDTWDWAIVRQMVLAKAAGNEIDLNALRDLYLEVMLSAVDTYDGVAREALGRSPAHVLLAHENDLQALFIGDLVAALRKRGWTIVTPDEAFADPIAKEAPDTLHTGNGRVAALAAVRGMPAARLRDRYHDEKLLAELFEQRVIRK
jgi:peptidoglycan/xylan/chitin deacetylase (PgdA/CDA1 family)